MIDDLLTVMWKDRKGLLRVRGSRARAVLTLAVPVILVGIVMPLQFGTEWLSTAFSVMASVIIPLLLVGTMIPESFAGERERHTLETLLASRLPDDAILFGKLLMGVAYGWGITLFVLIVSLVPVNILHWSGQVVFFTPVISLANVVISLLVSVLVASLGVLISLRAETIQGAQQTLMSVLLIPLFIVQVVPMLLMSVVPDGKEILGRVLSADGRIVMAATVAILLVLDVVLFLLVKARFRRPRLLD